MSDYPENHERLLFKLNFALKNIFNIIKVTEAALNHTQIFTKGQIWCLQVIHT